MRKALFVILSIIIMYSCASSTFYAYDNVEDEVYCTIEVDKKGITSYRGISIYRDLQNPIDSFLLFKRFIYMKSVGGNKDGYVELKRLYYTYHIDEPLTYFDASVLFPTADSCFMHNYISYRLEGDSAYFDSSKCILESVNFKIINRCSNWLPPYFIKVDKIDYSKYSMFKVKDKYLKNPEKKGSPKSWEK